VVEVPSPELVARICSGVKVMGSTLGDARAVEVARERRNGRGWPAWVVGARFVGPEFDRDSIGTWAIGHDGGTVFPLNEVARAFTFWGESARPGSRADAVMGVVADYPEALEAEGAVRAT
jgi:hypothetical protein